MPFSKSALLSRLIGLITRNGAAKWIRFVFLTLFFAVVLSSLPVHLKHDGASAESRHPRRTQGLASRNLPNLSETYGNAASGGPRNEPGLNGPSPIAAQSSGVVTVYPSSYQTPTAGGEEAVDSPDYRGHGSTTSSRQIWNSNGINSQTKGSLWTGFQNVPGNKARVTVKFDWSFNANVDTAIADQSGYGRAYARLEAGCSGGSMTPRELEVRVMGEQGLSDTTYRSGSESINLPNPNSINLM
jgi:hypothetical protein